MIAGLVAAWRRWRARRALWRRLCGLLGAPVRLTTRSGPGRVATLCLAAGPELVVVLSRDTVWVEAPGGERRALLIDRIAALEHGPELGRWFDRLRAAEAGEIGGRRAEG